MSTYIENKFVSKSWLSSLSVGCIAALSGITGPVLFLSIITIAELLQYGYDRIRETISMLVLGPYGWLVTVGFFLFGFLFIVFTLRLYSVVNKTLSSRIGIILLGLVGLGFFLVGIFPTQAPDTTLKLHALIHKQTAGAMSLLFSLACLALALGFRRDPRWKKLWLYTLITGSVTLILIIVAVPVASDWGWKGLHERVLLISGLVWTTVIAVRLIAACLHERRKLSTLAY